MADIHINTNIGEVAEDVKKLTENVERLEKAFKRVRMPFKLDAQFTKKFQEPGGAPDQGPKGGSIITPGTPANNLLKFRTDTEALKYYRTSNSMFARIGTMIGGVTSGIFSMSMGGGFGGLYRGVERGMVRSAQDNKGWLASLAGGTIAGQLAGGATGAAAGANEARYIVRMKGGEVSSVETTGAVAGAEVGAGFGILQWLSKLPLYVKAIGGSIGAEFYAMDKFTHDVWDRSRRAGGFGADMGKMTAFETTMGRYVSPDDVIKGATQSMYDITSPAYTAMRVLGLNPRNFQDPTDLSREELKRVQAQLKQFGGNNRETMLTLAHAHLFQNLGLSDEDLMRLYQGGTKDVNDLLERAKKEAGFMGLPNDQIKAYQDLYTETDITAQELKTLGEKVQSETIPGFMTLDRGLLKTAQTADYLGEGLAKGLNDANKAAQDFGLFLHDWLIKNTYQPDLPTPDSSPFIFENPGINGLPGSGAPWNLRRRGTRGGMWPNTGMTGVPASSAEVQAAMDEAKKSGKFADTIAGHTAFIKMMAPKYGIDPNFAVDVAGSEGLFSKRKSQGSYVDVDPRTGQPYSFWDFQLNYKKGVGTFAAKEGIDPNHPEHWMKADEFALRWIATHGLGDWRTDAAFRKYHGQVKHVPVEKPDMPTTGPTSMNDMRNFQTKTQLAMTIHNAPGANYTIHGAMLGYGSGNYGSWG